MSNHAGEHVTLAGGEDILELRHVDHISFIAIMTLSSTVNCQPNTAHERVQASHIA